MRTLVLIGCGLVAAGLSGGANAASRTYTNDSYCFSALNPPGMSLSTIRQGAQFNSGKSCQQADDPGCTFILVYGMFFFQETDLLSYMAQMYESEGWVLKPDGDFGPVKGWRQQTLVKGTGDQQKELHLYARPLRRSERASREGVVLAVGYGVTAAFNSSQRETFSKSVREVLTSWRTPEGCDPFAPNGPKP